MRRRAVFLFLGAFAVIGLGALYWFRVVEPPVPWGSFAFPSRAKLFGSSRGTAGGTKTYICPEPYPRVLDRSREAMRNEFGQVRERRAAAGGRVLTSYRGPLRFELMIPDTGSPAETRVQVRWKYAEVTYWGPFPMQYRW